MEEEEYAVEGYKPPRGLFGVKGTLRDILGTIGDAFLVQSGNDSVYDKRRQQEREAEALVGYNENPEEALRRYTRVNPDKGMAARDRYEDNRRLNQTTQEVRDTNTHRRALALLGALTPSTYKAGRQRYYDYYKTRGAEPMVDLPDEYDEDALSSLLMAGIDPDNQATLRANREYRDAVLSQRDEQEEGRNARAAASRAAAMERYRLGIQTRRDLAAQSEEGRNSRFDKGEAGRDRRSNKGGSGGSARPNFKVITLPDGSKRVVRQ